MSDGYNELVKVVKNPPKNVKFTGIIDREKMNLVYNSADVMTLLSFDELFPMTILEAMCVNIPILLRDLPIYNNILFDFYYREKDVDGFVRELEKLRTDKDYYAEWQIPSAETSFTRKNTFFKCGTNFTRPF